MIFFDAHNHLQDERLAEHLDAVMVAARDAGVARMVVNGTCAQDWQRVAALARRFPQMVLPAFGLHPWHVTEDIAPHGKWLDALRDFLTEFPGAPVGEIGLHKCRAAAPVAVQIEAVRTQLALARELRRPLVLHCVRAFGALEGVLRESNHDTPFLMHSYGGSPEQMRVFAKMGGWFSCSAHSLRTKCPCEKNVFADVPLERLLVETDAPDGDGAGFNVAAIYAAAAALRGMELPAFAEKMAANFTAFFGSAAPPPALPCRRA